MITPDGTFDWMKKMPGPLGKVWLARNLNDGVVFHSAVGSLEGVVQVVMGTAKASVTGVIGYQGEAVQFYPVSASPWANGSRVANTRFLGFEFEGGRDVPGEVDERLTEQQIDRAVRILKDLSHYKGVGYGFWQREVSLWEHNEMTRFGADPTACPTGRS